MTGGRAAQASQALAVRYFNGGLSVVQAADNNTLHTEPRAARLFLLASLSPRPGERWRYLPSLLMIFGDPNDFAIEAHHEPSGAQWGGFGRLCIYINGNAIGDIRDNYCSLFAITNRFRELPTEIGSLWSDRFTGLTDDQIFRVIDDVLYIGSDHDIGANFGRFDFLTNTGEMFNATKTFLYCESGSLVHLLYRVNDGVPQSGACDIELFTSTSNEYVRWFDHQVEAICPPYHPINPFDQTEQIPND